MLKDYTKIDKLCFLSELSFKYCDEFIKALEKDDLKQMKYFNDLTRCITKVMEDISKNG